MKLFTVAGLVGGHADQEITNRREIRKDQLATKDTHSLSLLSPGARPTGNMKPRTSHWGEAQVDISGDRRRANVGGKRASISGVLGVSFQTFEAATKEGSPSTWTPYVSSKRTLGSSSGLTPSHPCAWTIAVACVAGSAGGTQRELWGSTDHQKIAGGAGAVRSLPSHATFHWIGGRDQSPKNSRAAK